MSLNTIVVSFRGEKFEFPWDAAHAHTRNVSTTDEQFSLTLQSTIGDLRRQVATGSNISFSPSDIKLIFKGKILVDDDTLLSDVLLSSKGKQSKNADPTGKTFRIMASGISQNESNKMDQELQQGVKKAKSTVRDDLTEEGQRRMRQRKLKGQQLLHEAKLASQRSDHINGNSTSQYGFGRIETLPNLPHEEKAREILTSLANDPGVKACMAKHRWNVGSLAEMYPEGKVGSEVCIMGLNKNKGAQILLRIRTDDLQGFRKILSIREVLYHELAHNVYSEHDGKFFQLMRQIKKECLELDWTQGQGTTTEIDTDTSMDVAIEGGTFRLGGEDSYLERLTPRERARQAAIWRLGTPNASFASQQCLDCREETEREDAKPQVPKNEPEDGHRMDEM